MAHKRIHLNAPADEAGEIRRRTVVETLRPRAKVAFEALRAQGLDVSTAAVRALSTALAEQRREAT